MQSSTTTTITVGFSYPESNGGLSLTKYTVYLDVGQTGTPTSTITMTDTSQNYYASGILTSGALVDVQITAWNINGESDKSDVQTFYVATAPATPSAPTET